MYIILYSFIVLILWTKNCYSCCQPLLYLTFFHQNVKMCCTIPFRRERWLNVWKINCWDLLVLLGKSVTHQNVCQNVILAICKKFIPKLTLCHSPGKMSATVICNEIRQCERWTQSKHQNFSVLERDFVHRPEITTSRPIISEQFQVCRFPCYTCEQRKLPWMHDEQKWNFLVPIKFQVTCWCKAQMYETHLWLLSEL